LEDTTPYQRQPCQIIASSYSAIIIWMLQVYPSLTEEEFVEGCRAVEKRCHDGLSGLDWLSVKWTGSDLQIIQSRAQQNRDHSQPSGGVHENSQEIQDQIDDEAAINDSIEEEADDQALVSECLIPNMKEPSR
jgi:hypothetical protein